MIQSKSDLKLYITEDAKRNNVFGRISYWRQLLCGYENALAFRYLKCMRIAEYHYNNKSLLHKSLYAFYRIKLGRLGAKYMIQIPINRTGYGLRIMHLSGGYFVECQ